MVTPLESSINSLTLAKSDTQGCASVLQITLNDV